MVTLPNTYRRIGRGCCGSVWTEESSPLLAIKRGDGSELRSVKQDSDTQQLILERFSCPDTMASVNIPLWHDFIASTDEEKWAKYKLSGFPMQNQVPCDALVTERLRPFKIDICSRLIDLYCPSAIKEKFSQAAMELHPDCILRLYLGKAHDQARKSQLLSFTLNNLPIWVDRARTLGLDTIVYARVMGKSLALLHWVAGIDADDVEWVLAPPRDGQDEGVIDCEALGKHALWVIDFDRCRAMELSESGVRQAVAAFWRNDPYYPRPGQQDEQGLWDVFKQSFLQTSCEVLPENHRHLATLWLDLVEKT